jgi:hypothetical protein
VTARPCRWGTARRDRFVICHNPERARAELAGALKTRPACNRFLRATASGKLRIDRAAITRDAHFDGKFLLHTSDESLSATDIAEGYLALYEAERGFRDVKGAR